MDEIIELLEQSTKGWFYRKDGSPLADLQYAMILLVRRLESILQTVAENYKLDEKIEDFKKYRNLYFKLLQNIITRFSKIIKSNTAIDEDFVQDANLSKESLMKEYNSSIQYANAQEAKTINDMIFAYQVLLRAINAYIKNNDFNVEFIKVENPIHYFSASEDYIEWLQNFINDQEKLKLED